MTPIAVNELAHIVNAVSVQGNTDGYIRGVCIDNRQTEASFAYVAIVGQRVDGHSFVNDAFHRGASVAIVTKPVKPQSGKTVIQVTDPLAAIQAIAKHDRLRFERPIVAITGSNGKTTTKEMTAQVLGAMGECLFTRANRNNELGLPLTILQRNDDHRSIVLEMGMRGFGQISELCQIARPTCGIITNIGQSHIELLGSQEGIARAKGELLDALPEEGHAILNVDDPWLRKMGKTTRAKVIYYGFSEAADVRAVDIVHERDGMSFTVLAQGERASVHLPTFGRHNVANALAAICAGIVHGVPLQQAAHRLRQLGDIGARLRVVPGRNSTTVIDDCYNASPLSMKASLDVLRDFRTAGPRVAILGDMYELGDYTESGHREVGQYTAEVGIDTVIAVGEHARWIAEEARAATGPCVRDANTVAQLLERLDDWIAPNSTVLVKASRGMQLEEVVDALTTKKE